MHLGARATRPNMRTRNKRRKYKRRKEPSGVAVQDSSRQKQIGTLQLSACSLFKITRYRRQHKVWTAFHHRLAWSCISLEKKKKEVTARFNRSLKSKQTKNSTSNTQRSVCIYFSLCFVAAFPSRCNEVNIICQRVGKSALCQHHFFLNSNFLVLHWALECSLAGLLPLILSMREDASWGLFALKEWSDSVLLPVGLISEMPESHGEGESSDWGAFLFRLVKTVLWRKRTRIFVLFT